MHHVADFPRPVTLLEDVPVVTADGTRLSCRIWLPQDAAADPVPAIVEHLPYRKRDGTVARDALTHPYFAGHGYACIRVDMRGNGDSAGLMEDEYTATELDDACAVIAWARAQPWCTGKVGMIGISWGGFNGLQVAALRPEGLEAVVTICTSADRFADDIHTKGGCQLTANLAWATQMLAYSARPPDPAVVGPRWREMWLERLEHQPFLLEPWLAHQRRDGYWRHGSVCEDWGAIKAAVLAVGGWHDGYRNTPAKLVENLRAPAKAIVGPWNHKYPHFAAPGPAIGFLQEAVRWWDRWLRGNSNGIEQEPKLRVWMQESVKPAPQYAEMPGRWVAEDAWPSSRIEPRTLWLNAVGLRRTAAEPEELLLKSPQTCGLRGGEWCAFGAEGEMPRDQRPDDGFSLEFDSRPLGDRTEILGAPRLRLKLRADHPQANLCARLCDVAPDGSSLRVSYTVLNLTHRNGHEFPEALEPGEFFEATLELNDIAHAFPAGHRIRVALSSAYWPTIWPSTSEDVLGIVSGESSLELPVRPPVDSDAALRPFEPPDMAAAPTVNRLRTHRFQRRLETDLTTNVLRYELDGSEFDDASLVHLEEIDLEVGYTLNKRYSIQENDPLSAVEIIEQRAVLARGDWQVRLALSMSLTADAEQFHLKGDLRTEERGRPFADRSFDVSVPRKLL